MMATQPPVDDFTAAFDSLTVEPPAADPPAAEPVAEPVAEPPAAEPAADEPPAAEPPADEPPAAEPVAEPPAEDPSVGEPPTAEAPPAPDAAAEEAVLRKLSKMVNQTPPEPVAPAAAAPEPEQPIYTEEEAKVIDKFQEDWPEVAQAMDLRNRAFGGAILKYAFSEIMKEFRPIQEMVQAIATRTHTSDIREAIGDYTDDEVDAVNAWAKQQPAYLQKAMMGVIEGGTAQEVADLVNRYREANGIKPASAGTQAPRGDTELSGAAKQAATALAPVGSKRSVVQQPDDPSNYDAAWGRFADTT